MEKEIYLGIVVLDVDHAFKTIGFAIDRQMYIGNEFSERLTSYGSLKLFSNSDRVIYNGDCPVTLYSGDAPAFRYKDVTINGILRHILYCRGGGIFRDHQRLNIEKSSFGDMLRMIIAYNTNLSDGEFNYSAEDVVNNIRTAEDFFNGR